MAFTLVPSLLCLASFMKRWVLERSLSDSSPVVALGIVISPGVPAIVGGESAEDDSGVACVVCLFR